MKLYLVLCIGNFSLGWAGAWLIQTWGKDIGTMDIPSHRSSHSKAVPKGGGIGLLMAFGLDAYVLNLPCYFWGPALALGIVSFAGDRCDLSPVRRLIIQFGCSLIFLLGAWRQTAIDSWFIIPLASVFIVGTSNFFNFMDGIDGISGVTGMIGFFLFWLFGFISDSEPGYKVLCLSLAFACLGFLPFNCPRARVFMGDIGSILLGFAFSCMAVFMAKDFTDFLCLAGFLFLYYSDEFSTMVIRMKDGESMITPHRRHLYQLLVNEKGIKHWRVALGYGMGQILIGICLLSMRSRGVEAVMAAMAIFFICFCFFSVWVRSTLAHR